MPLQLIFTSHILILMLLIIVIRGVNARRMVSSLRKKTRATYIIQKYYRRWAARKNFVKIRAASVLLQSGNNFSDLIPLNTIYGLVTFGS